MPLNLSNLDDNLQLDLEIYGPKEILLRKSTAFDAFNYAFSKDYLNYAYKNFVGLKQRGRGVDGVTHFVFERNLDVEYALIEEKVKNGTYRFTPYLEVLRSKGRGKAPRVLSTPTIRDKLTLFCLKDFLQYLYQDHLKKVHASEHVAQLCKFLNNDVTKREYFRGDLHNFYPSIPRTKLIQKLKHKFDYQPFLKIVDSSLVTKTKPMTNSGSVLPGVPQGLSISNILADIYLNDLDNFFNTKNLFYARFVDDIIIAGNKSRTFLSTLRLKYWIWRNGLKLNKEKSQFGNFERGIDYLGYNIKVADSEVIAKVSVRKSSQQKLIDSVCGLITSYKFSENQKHLERLNRRITGVIWRGKRYGWLFYFSELNDESLLKRLDSITAGMLKKHNIDSNGIKKFFNSYWRIKKGRWGKYITNFDKYTESEMIDYLVESMDKKREYFKKFSYDDLYKFFSLEIQKEIDKMERDIGEIS